jgi:hypothetical protein
MVEEHGTSFRGRAARMLCSCRVPELSLATGAWSLETLADEQPPVLRLLMKSFQNRPVTRPNCRRLG